MNKRRCADNRGVAIVEMAIVFPLLMTVLLGIIEVSFWAKDDLSLANITRAGARIASAEGTTATTDYDALVAAVGAGTQISSGIRQIVIFKSDASGVNMCPKAASGDGYTASLLDHCNVYDGSELDAVKHGQTYADFSKLRLDQYWLPSGRSNSLSNPTGPDYVGVYINFLHPTVTGLFGSGVTATDTTTMRIEPVFS